MTFRKLNDIIKKNTIPENVRLLSDSGWECDATDMDCIYYCKDANELVFTQWDRSDYSEKSEYERLYPRRMPDRWKGLKESIIELHDDEDTTGEQREICNFLVGMMDILEKHMTEEI